MILLPWVLDCWWWETDCLNGCTCTDAGLLWSFIHWYVGDLLISCLISNTYFAMKFEVEWCTYARKHKLRWTLPSWIWSCILPQNVPETWGSAAKKIHEIPIRVWKCYFAKYHYQKILEMSADSEECFCSLLIWRSLFSSFFCICFVYRILIWFCRLDMQREVFTITDQGTK